ncbi:hypothetical protein Pta02_31350 [Planobispora takensis]|uniref:Uncharacterized protein n=1 Tax=Planobispora takensis TaxID=1367882 RepID=A0A8J3SV71_9ACTN|nr:hypothetical protein Pta02_31350 [Planobispora takensis]
MQAERGGEAPDAAADDQYVHETPDAPAANVKSGGDPTVTESAQSAHGHSAIPVAPIPDRL